MSSTDNLSTSLHYQIPSWAGKPPAGYHLDVYKDNKLIQKLMIDEKKCYHFGRNPTLNDVCIDHQSCSRVHAALVYHKHLNRAFLVDLGSTHGTFIGSFRLEANKPTPLPINSTFHFGASTRYYFLREKPNASNISHPDGDSNSENIDGGPLNLPESEMELDNLTEFNTAHNKRISMLGIKENEGKIKTGPRTILVRFKEEEDIINPEDVDPTVGKFRNLVQTTIIPKKKIKLDSPLGINQSEDKSYHILKPQIGLSSSRSSINPIFSTSLSIKLGIPLPNPAPDVDLTSSPEKTPEPTTPSSSDSVEALSDPGLPKKKKYAKEAWPGRRPTLL